MDPRDEARQIGVVQSWLAHSGGFGGVQNPGANTIIADTGPVAFGYYDIVWMVTTNCALTAGQLDIQWRNAANDANIADVPLFANSQLCFIATWPLLKVSSGESFRVFSSAGFTGVVGAGIFAIRRA